MKVQYADTVDCAKKVLKYEGIQGLYRGISLQLAYVATGNKYIEAEPILTIPQEKLQSLLPMTS